MIDFLTAEAHFAAHLLPIYRALELELRGAWWTSSEELAGDLERAGVDDVRIGSPTKKGPPIVTSSSRDAGVAQRTSRKVILSEHGAGQSYGTRHSSYVGGKHRDRISLFLVPSEAAAARNRRAYPRLPVAVVGSPRVEELARIRRRPGPPTVAVSFHWRATVSPEAGTAFDHYRPELERAVDELRAAGVEVLGHGHPRIFEELEPYWRSIDVEPVARFEEVLERADVYAVDNSSTLFEFAACGRPVVVLNAPQYRRGLELGLRFWSEADVGRNVDGPDELVAGVLEALEDPLELRRSREAAVSRVYALVNGSAQRAADAVAELVKPRSCPVCGRAHASCGPTSPETLSVVDLPERTPAMRKSPLRRYPNPERPGAFLKLTEEHARALGIDVDSGVEATRPGPVPHDVTNPGGDGGPVTSVAPAIPEGALPPGGKTARARAEAAEHARREALAAEYEAEALAALSELSPEELEALRELAGALEEAEDGQDGTGEASEGPGDGREAPEETPGAPDAPSTEDPKDKQRRPPSRRRPAGSS